MSSSTFKNFALVVEDNPSDSLLDKYVIEDAGLVAVCVNNGFSALDEVDKYNFSIIVVDLQMPQMNGVELIKRLRKYDRTKLIPIIVTSSRNEQKDILTSINSGANDYLIKPVEPALFKTKIDMQIKKSKADWFEYSFDNSQEVNTVKIHYSFKIISINEIGCIVESPLPFEPEEQILVGDGVFKNFSDGPIISKVIDIKKNQNIYKVSLLFLGLSEEKRQKLRVFCRKLYVNSLAENKPQNNANSKPSETDDLD